DALIRSLTAPMICAWHLLVNMPLHIQRDQHSFPTRRSSDLSHPAVQQATIKVENRAHAATAHLGDTWQRTDEWYDYRTNARTDRSEEHTSELQSRENIVCRLLLEKKNK